MLRRRDFLAGIPTAFAAVNALQAADESPADPAKPDLIVINARVFTVDERLPKAEAFAVHNGRFIAVGSTERIKSLAGPQTKTLNAEGTTVVPGFIDAHTHPAATGISELRDVSCDFLSIPEIQAAMKERAKKTPPGRWVKGFKYDDTKLREGRPLSRKDLDAVVPDHPAEVLHRGGHTAIYNSVALKIAGIDKQTRDPDGGSFGRDANGELNGFAAEKARLVFEKIAPEPEVTRGDRQAAVKVISSLMAASGLTSVHDADATPDDFLAYQDARAVGELSFRVYVLGNPELFATWKAARLRTGFGDAWLRIGGLKLYCDGSCSERTMRMSTAYEGRPGYFGILTTNQAELNDAVEDAHRHHFQVGVHANGDVAIDMVLKAYERMLQRHPHPDARPRIEHCTLINPALLQRMAKLGAIPTPFYTYVHFHGNKWAAYGEQRLRSMFAHRSFLDHGIKVAGASDYVPGPFEPLMAMQSMVTRTDFEGRVWGPNQRISVDDALRVGTIHGAYASFEEAEKGSITPGKLADFVQLEQDPHDVPPDQIKRIRVLRTAIGGRMVHEA